MTCIAGLEHEGRVYIGGDSAGVSGWSLTVRADGKVFTDRTRSSKHAPSVDYVVGFTTSFRMGQLIRYCFEAPPLAGTEDIAEWLVTSFVPELRRVFGKHGYEKSDNGRVEGGDFLIGLRGELHRISSDFQMGRAAAGFDAVGCGGDIAVGALYTATRAGRTADPRESVLGALEAAEALNAGVRSPFVLVTA